MEHAVLSMEYVAAVKVAIEICNSSCFKGEILCGTESDFRRKKEEENDWGEQWKEMVEMKIGVALERLGLPQMLKEKVSGLTLLVGMRMLAWAVYHEKILELDREYCINFLNSCFFTTRGIIDNRKAAEVLIADESLSTKQRYSVACLYCFTDEIPLLYNQLKEDDLESFDNPRRYRNEVGMIKFWSYYLIGVADELKGSKSLERYRLMKAVESGIVAAVQYCLDETKEVIENDIVFAAAQALTNVAETYDTVVFDDEILLEAWIPKSFYMDILSFLFRKMRDDQKIELFKIDLQSNYYGRRCAEAERYSRILEHFLNWPYQDYFMKTALLMWEFLPETSYAVLLVSISDIIDCNGGVLETAQDKSYDYRGLLKQFWCRSPEHFKRYVLSNPKITYQTYTIYTRNPALQLLMNLVTLKRFTYEDGEIIRIIFSSANRKEKENIMFSEEWKKFCITRVEKEDWISLDRFMVNYFSSKEEENMFKKKLICQKEARRIFINFVKDRKWNAVESFLKWSPLSEEEISKFKEGILYSEDGKEACRYLLWSDFESIKYFITWCSPSDEEAKLFIKNIVFDPFFEYSLLRNCASFVINDASENVEEFLHFCQCSAQEMRQLKKSVADRIGCSFCKELISAYGHRWSCTCPVWRIEFQGGQWEKVEKLLTWCFSSEEEINDYKKGKLLEETGKEIHYNLIKSNQWEETETFFAWLGLSAEETKKLKKETLFYLDEASKMYRNMFSEETADENFVFGSEQELREPFLRWYLTDKAAVLEFKEKFRHYYIGSDGIEKAGLQEFDLLTEKLLQDFDKEQIELKRKSEVCSSNKRICN